VFLLDDEIDGGKHRDDRNCVDSLEGRNLDLVQVDAPSAASDIVIEKNAPVSRSQRRRIRSLWRPHLRSRYHQSANHLQRGNRDLRGLLKEDLDVNHQIHGTSEVTYDFSGRVESR
jgi:hypothetical protein